MASEADREKQAELKKKLLANRAERQAWPQRLIQLQQEREARVVRGVELAEQARATRISNAAAADQEASRLETQKQAQRLKFAQDYARYRKRKETRNIILGLAGWLGATLILCFVMPAGTALVITVGGGCFISSELNWRKQFNKLSAEYGQLLRASHEALGHHDINKAHKALREGLKTDIF